MNKEGCLVVSLDFELLWGLFDLENKDAYYSQILGGREGILQLLELFEKYDIHATWGVVGLLFAETISEMKEYYPEHKPKYFNHKLSSEAHLESVGKNEEEDKFHFASSLIDKISNYDNQEIASHTFSHYYCKEFGQDVEIFKYDLESAQRIAKDKKNIVLKSLILPRNQFLVEYGEVAKNCGFKAIRGNPSHFAYNNSNIIARAIRLLDSYLNICGYKCYDRDECLQNGIANIKASRFFRKYNKKLKLFENLKISCIKRQMRYAAKNGKIFHLWWHPHNIGANTSINLNQLESIFIYFKKLKEEYCFSSKNMNELARELFCEDSNSAP